MIGKRARFEIFKRDLFTCQYCGQRPPDVMLEVDHIVASASGGSDEPHNLTTACLSCNRGKGAVGLGEVAPAVNELEVLGAVQEMLERKQMIESGLAASTALRESEEMAAGKVWDWLHEFGGGDLDQVIEFRSLCTFVRLLDIEDVRDAVDHARQKQGQLGLQGDALWRFFCWVCWQKIRNLRRDQQVVEVGHG